MIARHFRGKAAERGRGLSGLPRAPVEHTLFVPPAPLYPSCHRLALRSGRLCCGRSHRRCWSCPRWCRCASRLRALRRRQSRAGSLLTQTSFGRATGVEGRRPGRTRQPYRPASHRAKREVKSPGAVLKEQGHVSRRGRRRRRPREAAAVPPLGPHRGTVPTSPRPP